jgi:DNA-binding NarL/FixJ family response regulator
MKLKGFILVIDSYLVRKGIVAVLNRMHGVRVLKEFGAGDPFMVYLKSHQVDYMIMGQAEFDRSADLFIEQPELLERMVLIHGTGEAGHKAVPSQQDAHKIIHLLEEKDSIIHKIQNLLDPAGRPETESPATKLSPRETTIVRLVSMGLTNRQIADKLFLSAHTVMTHRKNISSKLGIKSVSGLTIYAIVNNIITLEEVSSLAAK